MKIQALVSILLIAACSGGSASDGQAKARSVPIAAIQGPGQISPLRGSTVMTRGIVSGDFQTGSGSDLAGFFLMSESPDDNPQTSEGLFVFDGKRPRVDVSFGDRVEVVGEIVEHFGETQLKATRVDIVGKGKPSATIVSLPSPALMQNSDGVEIADLERYEGMWIRLPQVMTISSLHDLESFGSIELAAGERPQQFTNRKSPDPVAYRQHRQRLAARSLVLDDGLTKQFPHGKRLPETVKGTPVRAGDSIAGLSGILRYSRGSGPNGDETWRLVPHGEIRFESTNPRPAKPRVDGEFRIASFNVLNFFATTDDGRPVCGPAAADNCRGADSRDELERQRDKLITALDMLDADVVGLIELENNGDDSLSVLVDSLNLKAGAGTYRYVATGSIRDDAIRTALIYRPATVEPVGKFALLDHSVDPRFNDARNRPALAQTFRQKSNGARLTVAVNHLKSKGSSCEPQGDPNRGDGQANCSGIRTAAAAALADWLQSDPTGSKDKDFLIIGDLNAYPEEDPIGALLNAGLVDLMADLPDRYSFLYDAQIGALDHAIASPSLASQVRGVLEWHINADEAPLFDYNLENDRPQELFDADTPYRASDHDPLVIGFDLQR